MFCQQFSNLKINNVHKRKRRKPKRIREIVSTVALSCVVLCVIMRIKLNLFQWNYEGKK